jgi:hypothetical protein
LRRAHLAGRDDGLVRVQPLIDRAPRFADLLDTDADDPAFAALRRSELIGRPHGDDAFLDAISRRLNRVVTRRERGRKPKGDVSAAPTRARRAWTVRTSRPSRRTGSSDGWRPGPRDSDDCA